MSKHCCATHQIFIAAPIDQCHRFFTPAGEALWVDGWQPSYLFPTDGRTERGMIFTTGSGDDFTIWNLVDFDPQTHYSRYSRVTPALRTGTVEIKCKAQSETATEVTVSYTLTALTPRGEESLVSFEGAAFAEMIEEWKRLIDFRLPALIKANIR